ncbi:Dihydrolipoamide succinyltransferase component (E2) of 2-oxoglutarate dehydrogenase complex (EC [Olavius algarvensis associated proteobacterium Delta 3]|nr:Dihydrolipoamide succinyltransferase component (E2) of 2-oxoglutarate dehydrogenase complex (EC [Olavius algarvensis associated proteobacterium Delta 3]CAB5173127.1 Dihydrolipoamide succinyltransferase component (E2) of 2-oxoglutarate dehydrogenase complex (EC [Olavius algarvensis associated proteobacterium Delta 3]
MLIEVKIPSVGESVTEAILAEWYKQDGDVVQKDDPLFVIETDKVTLEVVAEASGVLKITVPEGDTVPIGAVVGTIDSEGAPAEAEPAAAASPEAPEPEAPPVPEPAPPAPAPEAVPAHAGAPEPETPAPVETEGDVVLSPSVRRLVAETGIDVSLISGTGPGGRITKGDVMLYIEQTGAAPTAEAAALPAPMQAKQEAPAADAVVRKPMTPIRQRIAARLLEAKQNTAMLTTFNEIDMSRVMAVRASYKEAFQKKYGISLGFMSFFLKASVEALKEFPAINAYIEDKDIVYHNYTNIGVAIGGGKGLVVPVIRNAESLSFAELERAIVDFVEKIKDNRLELSDLEGGTFTITNGGVFGSLLSTPILNTPQSGILGMHKIEKRPIVIDDEIVIRPMMYVALSYDHRIVDGREAVTCLRRMKEFLEDPERMLLEI